MCNRLQLPTRITAPLLADVKDACVANDGSLKENVLLFIKRSKRGPVIESLKGVDGWVRLRMTDTKPHGNQVLETKLSQRASYLYLI